MPTLVPIPWQPHLYLTPHTLALLVRASNLYGSRLYLYDNDYRRISPAWRSWSQQLTAWLNYRAGRGPVASSPFSGQRNHMRGAAFDIRAQSERAQNACHDVGLIRDTVEPWHWNDPNWRTMPVIRTNSAGTGGTATLEALVSAAPTGLALFSDAKSKVGYLLDMTITDGPRIQVLGKSTAVAWKALRKSSPYVKLTREEVVTVCKRYGVQTPPDDLLVVGKFPAGTILKTPA